MSDKDLINKLDLEEIKAWLKVNQAQMPESVGNNLAKMLRIYAELSKGAAKAKQVLLMLRQAMGILPKSEKGSSEIDTSKLTLEQLQELADLKKKRDQSAFEKRDYQRKIKSLLPKPKNFKQLELLPAEELIFSTPTSARQDEGLDEPVERQVEFGKEKGLHSTYESVKRVDLNILVAETTHNVETVTDFTTGKSVRAPMDHVGPEGFQMTWRAFANLVKLHVGFAIPINRLALLIGQPEFTSGKI